MSRALSSCSCVCVGGGQRRRRWGARVLHACRGACAARPRWCKPAARAHRIRGLQQRLHLLHRAVQQRGAQLGVTVQLSELARVGAQRDAERGGVGGGAVGVERERGVGRGRGHGCCRCRCCCCVLWCGRLASGGPLRSGLEGTLGVPRGKRGCLGAGPNIGLASRGPLKRAIPLYFEPQKPRIAHVAAAPRGGRRRRGAGARAARGAAGAVRPAPCARAGRSLATIHAAPNRPPVHAPQEDRFARAGRGLLAAAHAPSPLERLLAATRAALSLLADALRPSGDPQDAPVLTLGHHYVSVRRVEAGAGPVRARACARVHLCAQAPPPSAALAKRRAGLPPRPSAAPARRRPVRRRPQRQRARARPAAAAGNRDL